jgi:hypothetical protein
MLQQVRDSMPTTDYYDDQIAIVQAKDAEELVGERLATLQHNIAYHDAALRRRGGAGEANARTG